MPKHLYISVVIVILSFPNGVQSQWLGPMNSDFERFRQNGISTVETSNGYIWISPLLNYAPIDRPDATWAIPDGVDSLTSGKGRVFSIATQNNTIVAGLGFSSSTPAGTVPAAYGYYISANNGQSWSFSPFPLDRYIDEDTTFVYGGIEYDRARIIVPEQSPPYSVAIKDTVLFSANWASGLLRSTSQGSQWERIALPPFGVTSMRADGSRYVWRNCVGGSTGTCSQYEELYTAVSDDNLKGFAVHIDRKNRVWYGSAGGINVSDNALYAPIDSIRWNNVGFNYDPNGLLARWVIEIAEDPTIDRIWLTNWITENSTSNLQGLDQYGIVFTDDGGSSFEQRLHGQKILSIGFFQGDVWAAGENGLFRSKDQGTSWEMISVPKSVNNRLKPNTSYQSISSTSDYLFIGTSDGLLWTSDPDIGWNIERVNFPLDGGNQYNPEAKTVSTYAYPNPFSPNLHGEVRIRFESRSTRAATLRIVDFGMNLVHEQQQQVGPGEYEIIWTGFNDMGSKVSNGVYFYEIIQGGLTFNGKILVID